jgi:hypothetical protein
MVRVDTRESIGGKRELLFRERERVSEENHLGLDTSVLPVRVETILLDVWLVGIGESECIMAQESHKQDCNYA